MEGRFKVCEILMNFTFRDSGRWGLRPGRLGEKRGERGGEWRGGGERKEGLDGGGREAAGGGWEASCRVRRMSEEGGARWWRRTGRAGRQGGRGTGGQRTAVYMLAAWRGGAWSRGELSNGFILSLRNVRKWSRERTNLS